MAWTRFLTLYIGHTTAAASAVVAAFLGGLAIGAAVGGRIATTLSPRRSLRIYVGLEVAVVIGALLLPFELKWFGPVLAVGLSGRCRSPLPTHPHPQLHRHGDAAGAGARRDVPDGDPLVFTAIR